VHDAGIVHRDLKPGNIFLARGRNDEIEPKLLDFGISKASGNEHMRLTAANGSLMGTPFYMAPEAVQGAEMTPLSDQYALGVVLRECITGKNPFEGGNFAEVVKLITTAQYPLLGEVNPRLSKRFVAIIDRAMSLDPNNRFPDMRAMGRQLLLLAGQRTRITWGLTFGQEGRGPLALATLERKNVPELPPAPPPKKRVTAALVAGVAVLSASVTSLFLKEREEAPRAEAVQMKGSGSTTTLVMPNAPEGEVSAAPSALPAPAPIAAPAPPVDEQGSAADEDEDERDSPSRAAPSETRKPQRVAMRREPERKAAKPAPQPRRRPQPPPQPQRLDEDVVWAEEINIASKAPRQDFEVGSNNAPILD
jgi:eukaryotic-like serine/threonine-protein kinase